MKSPSTILCFLSASAALAGCVADSSDEISLGGVSSGGDVPGAGGAQGGGAGGGDGGVGGGAGAGDGNDLPDLGPDDGVDILGAAITIWTLSEDTRVEVTLPLSGQALPAVFEIKPPGEAGPRGTLTQVGPPPRVYRATAGQVAIENCPQAVGDLLRGQWQDVVFEEVGGERELVLEGAFEIEVRTAQDADVACDPGFAEGGTEGDVDEECLVVAASLCGDGTQGPCCPFRTLVENCHEECGFGSCLDPTADSCPPCLEGCIENTVDAGCKDRYISLSRCQFAGGCVGANDPALTCTIEACCEELGTALGNN